MTSGTVLSTVSHVPGYSGQGDSDDVDAAAEGDYRDLDGEDRLDPEIPEVLADPAAIVATPKADEMR
jgi:hypothetical protein